MDGDGQTWRKLGAKSNDTSHHFKAPAPRLANHDGVHLMAYDVAGRS